MKITLITSLFVILTCHISYSQGVFPSFNVNPEWNVQRSIEPSLPGPIFIMSYHLGNDTVINQKTYSQVSRIGNQEFGKLNERIGYVRTDLKRVYFKASAKGKEYLLYDFGLKQGDKAYCPFLETDSAKYEVLNVDSITVNGVKRLRLKVLPEYYPEEYMSMYWIEGIGSTINPFYEEVFGQGGVSDELRCVTTNLALLYKNPKYSDCTTVNLKTNSIVDTNVVWSGMNIEGDKGSPGGLDSYHIRLNGDTVINDITYTRIWQSVDSLATNWQINGFIREENKKVYYHFLHYEGYEDLLLYDFSLEKGETQLMSSVDSWGSYESYKVTEVDSVLINGVKRLRIQLVNMSNQKITWIEKIGSLKGILNSFYIDDNQNKQLLCVTENNNRIYNNEVYPNCFYTLNSLTGNIPKLLNERILVYPNPVNGELFIQSNSTNEEAYTLELYLVKGALVKTECLEGGSNLHRIDVSSLKSGVYVLRLISASGRYSEEVIIKE